MKCKAFYCILVMVGWFWQGGLHLYAQSLRGVVTEAGKHCDHTIAIEALNLTNAKPPYCDTYNYKKNCISTTDAELSFPNIYYRITF